MFEMNEVTLWIIGLVASVVVYGVNYIQRKRNQPIDKKVLTFGLYAVSLVLVLVFGQFQFPALPAFPLFPPEPIAYIGALVQSIGLMIAYAGQWLTLLTAITGFAALPYNVLYKQVFERIAPLPALG